MAYYVSLIACGFAQFITTSDRKEKVELGILEDR